MVLVGFVCFGFVFLLNINYKTHIIENERQRRKIGKRTKLSLDYVLCGTSLGLKEPTQGEGVEGGDGHMYLFKPEGEKLLSLPLVISKYQSARSQSPPTLGRKGLLT